MSLVRDAKLFEYLLANAGALRRHQPSALQYLARRCMQLQELERSSDDVSACRDLGCAAARALERVEPGISPEEASVLGILVEVAYSYLAGALPIADLERVFALTDGLGFPMFHPSLYASAAELGRKSRAARSNGTCEVRLIRGIGQGSETCPCDPALLDHAMHLLESWGGQTVQWAELANGES